MQYVVVSHFHEKIAAEGEGIVVIYDYQKGSKTAMPDAIRRRIVALENK